MSEKKESRSESPSQSTPKIGFFRSIYSAVTDFDKYSDLMNKKTSKVIKYFFTILLIFSLLTAIVVTISFAKFDDNAPIATIQSGGDNNIEETVVIKQDILNLLSSNSETLSYFNLYLIFVVYILLIYTIAFIGDILMVAVFAYITSMIVRIKLTLANCIKISAYAITLPIILKLVYIYINTLTGFVISYFEYAYITIAYIYVLVGILMMRNNKNLILNNPIPVEDSNAGVEAPVDQESPQDDELETENPDKKKKDKQTEDTNEKDKAKLPKPNPEPEPGKA